MAGSTGKQLIGKISLNTFDISKISLGDVLVYSAGNIVTYYVDTDIVHQEEVDADETVLSPTTFTPSKSGWEFVGWRQDKSASSSVITNLTMGNNPITLYAVFRQAVTLTYYNGNTTAQTTNGYRYYNNLSITNPTFTITQVSLSNWTARGWSVDTTGDAAISYITINDTVFDANITLYGMYQQDITLSYNENGGSGFVSAESKARYYNSGSDAYVDPTFTVKENKFTKTGYAFSCWMLNSTSENAYYPNDSLTLSVNATLYASWVSSTLVVFSKEGYNINPLINNSTYVTLSGGFIHVSEPHVNGSCIGSIWYRIGTDTKNGSVTITPLAPYTKATVTLKCYNNGIYVNGTGGKKGEAIISGSFGSFYRHAIPIQWAQDQSDITATATGTSLTLNVTASATCDGNETWSSFGVYISNITLSI